ncbi:hypothetical protein [Bacillus wiedmannii]|uniref:hypothetical protein n=1 Tax=Bacillus wiedmannii TaxID=1890302 RepID=UPI001141B655|nr:hypothetical protein [Bacillus wiedmannii]
MKKIELVEAIVEVAAVELEGKDMYCQKLFKAVLNGSDTLGVDASSNLVHDLRTGEFEKVAKRVSKTDLENILEWATDLFKEETKEESEMPGKSMQERTEERIEDFLKDNKVAYDKVGDDDINFVFTYGHLTGLMFANEEGDTVLELSVELSSKTKELAYNVFTSVKDALPVMVAKGQEAAKLVREEDAVVATEAKIKGFLHKEELPYTVLPYGEARKFKFTYEEAIFEVKSDAAGNIVVDVEVYVNSIKQNIGLRIFETTEELKVYIVSKAAEARGLIEKEKAKAASNLEKLAKTLCGLIKEGNMLRFADEMKNVNALPLGDKIDVLTHFEKLVKDVEPSEEAIEKEIENQQFILESFVSLLDDGYQIEDEEILVGGRRGKEFDINLYTFSYFSLNCELNYNPEDKQYHLLVTKLDKREKLVTKSTNALKQFIKKSLDTL